MARPMSEAQRARSELGLAYRRRNSTPEQIAEARRNLTEANLTARIREAVAAWPPLTDAQRERLALLLHPGSGDAAA